MPRAIRDGVAKGDFTAREVAEAFNANVAAAEALNAFIVATPEKALETADAIDAKRAKAFAKYIKGIEVAARQGGADEAVSPTKPTREGGLRDASDVALEKRALDEALAKWSADDEVRAILIEGEGEKAFCAGGDVRSVRDEAMSDPDSATGFFRTEYRMNTRIHHLKKPYVALMDGVCMGGGLLIASVCDIRICGESSRFGVPINRLGMTVSYAELGALGRIVSPSAALEILLEGNVFGAAHAKELGLINHIVPDADVEREAQSLAQKISGRAPLVNRWHKKFVHRLQDPTPLTEEEIETVIWLVRHHLMMSNTAFKRDINDPKTVSDFVDVVQSLERLRLLLVLTVADIRAVGPNVWNAWKAALLRELYYAAEETMSGGLAAEGQGARVAHAAHAMQRITILSQIPCVFPPKSKE